VPELVTEDVTLHVEVDGEGEPRMVLAHGLTNSCRELVMLTGFVPGTKIRFCFRGHGHSSSPETGYTFADFARDVRAVADAYDATVAIASSQLTPTASRSWCSCCPPGSTWSSGTRNGCCARRS